jgi:type IV pilus assembly protein PilP
MTRPQLSALLVAAAVATSCGAKKKPAARAVEPPPVSSASSAAPAAAAHEPTPEWVYTSSGKRDPFRSFLGDLDSDGRLPMTRCTTPLGRFELDQLRLVAVITGLDDPVAMVEAPNGVGYSVRRGVCLGRNGGVVAAVRTGEVVISEWAIRADGTRDKTQTILRLPKEASLNIEE